MEKRSNNLDTLLLHEQIFESDTALSPPISYSATFSARDAAHFAEISGQTRPSRFYTRYGNPTHTRVAQLIADLEGAEAGLLAASGMGAISSAITGLLKSGDHVVAQTCHYMGTTKILSEFLGRYGVEHTLVDQTCPEDFAAAIRPNTKLILLETPANPSMTITDLEAVVNIAKKEKILTLCDNTFASPINQNPLKFGVDIVVHSATKYLGGHHDLTAGVIVGSEVLMNKIWKTLIVLGPTLSPMDAWLLLRGLRTLSVRVERQNISTLVLTNFLESQPQVERVFYPGLESHPQQALAKKQMRGFGGVFALAIKGGYAESKKFVSALKIPTNAVSLGGVESLVVHAAAMWEGSLNEAQLKASKIEPNLVRVSVGLENIEDLKEDFAQALKKV